MKTIEGAKEVLNNLGIDRSNIFLLPLDFWLSLEHIDEFLIFEIGEMETEEGCDYFFENIFIQDGKKSRIKILRLIKEQWEDKNLIKELNHLYNPLKRQLIREIISLNEQLNKSTKEVKNYKELIMKGDSRLFNKKLVLELIKNSKTEEINHSLDLHTIDIVVSFFENTHGPIPIIGSPEILKCFIVSLYELFAL